MRLRVSRASAEEQLTATLLRGYGLLVELENERHEHLSAKTWTGAEHLQAHRERIDAWLQEAVKLTATIFPTEREAYEVARPAPGPMQTVRGGTRDEYEWGCLMLRAREHAEALKNVIDQRVSAYTDLPARARLYVEDVDSFQKVRDVNPAMVSGRLDRGYVDLAEDIVQLALEQILGVSFHKKDWGGEGNDLYTANVIVNGARRATAFLLKGNGLRKKKMELADCGKNGDQVLRLAESPADLFVVQFVGNVGENVIKDLDGKVEALRAKGHDAHYCIIDGQDTARLLLAYGKLP